MTNVTFKQRSRTDWLVVHCAATSPDAQVRASDIRRWHLAKGWSDIGYHYVIGRDGVVEPGRPEAAVGAHVRGFNQVSLGICLIGGVDAKGRPENNFTTAQFASLHALLGELKARYPKARIQGHRDFSPDRNGDGRITPDEFIKACPCFDVGHWLAAYPLAD
ncbi:N-acetylmuramoyl-L-alanine amidase [Pseudomonas massiliensis]|uniref:N-acetylmuramoyl-L-alanine amidase n=1 Tax=Pseudomonas massiliensis TaxID=522492 RepID=UPI00058FA21D|nr:N-acetylmuramoyl-L-alanine amidase [Pseudomonas massiliensis]